MPSVIVTRQFSDVPAPAAAALRLFLDEAECASPFQDPAFCGDGKFGGGLAGHHFIVWDGARANFYAFCTDNHAMSRLAPFLRSVIVQKGPVASGEESFRQGAMLLREWARARRCLKLTIKPQFPAEHVSWMRPFAERDGWDIEDDKPPQATLRLDLAPAKAEILAGFDAKTRSELRRAERKNLTVRPAASERDIASFFDVHRKRGERKGFDTLDRVASASLARQITGDANRGAVFLAEQEGRALGGALVLRAGPRVHYVFGASETAGSNAPPVGYPALWAAIRWAKDTGARQFDFGGYAPQGDPNVRRFKRGFGGGVVNFIPPLSRALWRNTRRVRSILGLTFVV